MLLERAHHDVVGECILPWKSGRRNGIQTREKALVSALLIFDCREGAVVQLVVVAIVSKGGGKLRVGLQVGLILLFKERVLRGDSGVDRSWRGCENVEKTTENGGGEEEGPCLGTHADNITTVDRGG
jgi:hypothetical protein